MSKPKPILFTPGPVRIPPLVAQYLADPPCNYHRQDEFCDMLGANESDLKSLAGIANPENYFATTITSTGTGANEAVLLALAGTGKGLILRNGYFGNRAVDQATRAGLDHVVVDSPHDRPLDPAAVDAFLADHPEISWVFFVGHETRTGLANPVVDVGQACKRHGKLVGCDVISALYAYPVDIEGAQLDLAVASSAKALMAAPGIGIVFVHRDAADRLRATPRPRAYYLDIIAEYDEQRARRQPRFAQPVALHAAVRAACLHLTDVGIDNHFARIQRQMADVSEHLTGLGVHPILDAAYRSNIAINFRLPPTLPYRELSRRMLEQGFFLLYGIPGDDTHFQLSTIGHLDDDHIAGIKAAFTQVFTT